MGAGNGKVSGNRGRQFPLLNFGKHSPPDQVGAAALFFEHFTAAFIKYFPARDIAVFYLEADRGIEVANRIQTCPVPHLVQQAQ